MDSAQVEYPNNTMHLHPYSELIQNKGIRPMETKISSVSWISLLLENVM